MQVSLIGNNAGDVAPFVEEIGVEIVGVDENPDVMITYGGDGTLIGAEIAHPGVPKLPMRDNKSCAKCDLHNDAAVFRRLIQNELQETRLEKLEATTRGQTILGLNDILLRNGDLRSAVRFQVHVGGEPVTDEMIGDGLVAATPFGSSAYFRSITNTTFRAGIGIAFSNCTEFPNHMVLLPEDEVRVEIIRGPALLAADNTPRVLELASGDDIIIRRAAKQEATILGLDALRCPLCQYMRAPRRRF
ncbi:MAG: NAD+ kinase [Planctomycetota bacterium]|jgi:NAD+ kinase